MKIKYIAGKKLNNVEEVDEVKAKSLIEDGLALEEISADPMEATLKAFESKVTDIATKAATKAANEASVKTVDSITKGMSSRIVVGPDRSIEDPTGGFKHFGDFLNEIKNSGHQACAPTSRISEWRKKSTTNGNEGTAIDGGIAVPIQYAADIFHATDNRVPDFSKLIFQVPMQSSQIKIPVLKNYVRNNTTVANGVVAAYGSESANITQSTLNWEQLSLTLDKNSVMCPVSNELLEDNNVALGTVIASQAYYQLTKLKNGGIIASNGSAYTGIINHASTKYVKRATTQVIGFTDVLNMFGAFASDDANFDNAVWFCHPTVLSQLGNMTSGNFNIYAPPGFAGDGFTGIGRLLGRPLYVTAWCNTLGTKSDLLLADMSKYIGGYKGGVNSMVSPHVFFLTDEMAFRFTERVVGRPGLSGTITLEDGSTTVSPFVGLDLTIGGS